jgi:hypothetical protein
MVGLLLNILVTGAKGVRALGPLPDNFKFTLKCILLASDGKINILEGGPMRGKSKKDYHSQGGMFEPKKSHGSVSGVSVEGHEGYGSLSSVLLF